MAYHIAIGGAVGVGGAGSNGRDGGIVHHAKDLGSRGQQISGGCRVWGKSRTTDIYTHFLSLATLELLWGKGTHAQVDLGEVKEKM